MKVYKELENDASVVFQEMNKKRNKIQLSTFSIIPFVAKISSGKTTQMCFMAEQYLSRCQETQYDLDKYTILNGPITHYYYITPNPNDESIRRDGVSKCIQVVRAEEVNSIADKIMRMSDVMENILIQQDLIRKTLKNENFINMLEALKQERQTVQRINRKNIVEQTYAQSLEIFRSIIANIEQCKLEFDGLEIKEQKLSKQFSLLYEVLGIQWNGFVLRRPSVILAIDDLGNSDELKQQGSSIYQLTIQARHKSVMAMLFAIHCITNMYKAQREAWRQLVLFGEQDVDRLKQIFRDMSLEKAYYQFDQFLADYHKMIGYDKKADEGIYHYNFMYITSRPRMIFENWFDVISK